MYSISSENRFTWGETNGFDFEVDLGINAFRKYIKENELTLNKISKEFQQKITKISAEEYEGYEGQFLEYEANLITQMTQLHRFAVFMGIVAFYEGTLLEFCEAIEPQITIKKLRKIEGENDFERYWNYLKNKVKFELNNNLNNLFKVLNKKRELRHKVAHSKGKIDKLHIFSFVNDFDGISLAGNDEYFIIKEVRFLNVLLDEVEEFFTKLLIEIDKKVSSQ